MTRIASILAMSLAVWAVALRLEAAPPPPGLVVNGRITNVVDGDTLDMEIRVRVRVRLLSAWVPDTNRDSTLAERDAADAATRHLEDIALGEPATLFVPFTGARSVGSLFSFDRVLGRVWVYETDLSEAQVKAGHASSTADGRLGE